MHGFEYERGQGERDCDELSLQFWFVEADLDGELSFQEVCLGIFSFGRPVACLRRQPDRHVSPDSERNFGRTMNEDCLGVADRPTSHRCWASRSAFQGWQCLDNTSQCCCWRWKPIELSEEEMFTAFVHCGALLDPEREDVRGRDEHALKLQWSVSWSLKAKFSRIYSTHGSWYTFQVVIDDRSWRCGWDDFRSWESWDGNWLELEVLLTSLSWWWTGGGHCAERAWHWSLSWSAVLCCRSKPAHGDHISTL